METNQKPDVTTSLQSKLSISSYHRPLCMFCSSTSPAERLATVIVPLIDTQSSVCKCRSLCNAQQHKQNNISNSSSCLLRLLRDNEVCVCIGRCCRNSREPQMGCSKVQGTNHTLLSCFKAGTESTSFLSLTLNPHCTDILK